MLQIYNLKGRDDNAFQIINQLYHTLSTQQSQTILLYAYNLNEDLNNQSLSTNYLKHNEKSRLVFDVVALQSLAES